MKSDYFSQAAIDYLLGNVTSQVFDEFEATLGNKDLSLSLANVRANAIEQSTKTVVADQHEDLIGGWTLMSPQEPDTVRTFPFEEYVLLITDAAIYRVKFDWNIEKVASFERVDVRSIVLILKGTYITSTVSATQRDPKKNLGFVVRYRPGKENLRRTNTRSLGNAAPLDSTESSKVEGTPGPRKTKDQQSELKVMAFKAVERDSQEKGALSERELVNSICEQIQRIAADDGSLIPGFVEERDIISLEEARKSTGLLEQWSHSLKRFIWA